MASVLAAACATTRPPMPEDHVLGSYPKGKCFFVEALAKNSYRFVLTDMRYPRGAGLDRIKVYIHPVGFPADLVVTPDLLEPKSTLDLTATGPAGGQFEVTLVLVGPGGDGTAREPTKLRNACSQPPPRP